MTETQYRTALEKLDLTVAQGAIVLGIGRRQSFRYASGETPVPFCIERLLWFMSHCGVPEQWRP